MKHIYTQLLTDVLTKQIRLFNTAFLLKGWTIQLSIKEKFKGTL